MKFPNILALMFLAGALAAFTGSYETLGSRENRDPDKPTVATVGSQVRCTGASAIKLALDELLAPQDVAGGLALLRAFVGTDIPLDQATVDVTVPQGVAKPAGFPREVNLLPGETLSIDIELLLPPGDAAHDIILSISGTSSGAPSRALTNSIIRVGNPRPILPPIKQIGGEPLLEIPLNSPLRRVDR